MFVKEYSIIFLFCFLTVLLLETAALLLLGRNITDSLISFLSNKVTFFSKVHLLNTVENFLRFFITFTLIHLWNMNHNYLPSYLFFICALAVTLFTDFKELVISRYVTLYLIPVGWALSMFKMLPISPTESILGSIFGLILLWAVRAAARKFLEKEGLGQGDIDLLAFIGAFIGPFGCWISVMAGSLLACLIAVPYALITKQRDFKLPFGVFLSLGAILFTLYQKAIFAFFIPL